jgi:hypothetical protein
LNTGAVPVGVVEAVAGIASKPFPEESAQVPEPEYVLGSRFRRMPEVIRVESPINGHRFITTENDPET